MMVKTNWSTALTNWIVQNSILSDVVHIHQLKGATSSKLYLLSDSNDSKAVIRFYTNEDWNRREPDLAKHEAFSLQTAEKSSINTPSLFAYTYNKEITQFPVVLMSYLPGEVTLPKDETNEWLKELAYLLADFHSSLSQNDFPWSYYPYNKIESISAPQWLINKSEFQVALHFAKSYKPHSNLGFIHRDFHPVNVMWEGGKSTGIVDWPNACYGPKEVDIGHCRLNLALLYGVEEADTFLSYYKKRSNIDITDQSYWDLITLFDCLPDPDVYDPWLDFGMNHLTNDLIKTRFDVYFLSVYNNLIKT
jgi:Ser/Thr protein kinase RdoA (MazF antagonist)